MGRTCGEPNGIELTTHVLTDHVTAPVQAYTPVLKFWCILMWVGVLLCLSDVLQKCLHRARTPESVRAHKQRNHHHAKGVP